MIRKTTLCGVSLLAVLSLCLIATMLPTGLAQAQDLTPAIDGVWVGGRDYDIVMQANGDQVTIMTLDAFMSPTGEPTAEGRITQWYGPIAVLDDLDGDTGLLIAHSPHEVSVMVAGEDSVFVFRKLQMVPANLEGEWRGVALPPSPRPEDVWTLSLTAEELAVTEGTETTRWHLGALESNPGQFDLLLIGDDGGGLVSVFPLAEGAAYIRLIEGYSRTFRRQFTSLVVYRPDSQPGWVDEIRTDEELVESIITSAIMTEAAQHLRRLYDSSVGYYDADHTDNIGNILMPQFPASHGPTPSEIPCGTTHTPTYEDWDAYTWEALNFAISDPHYYSYQYESEGTRIGATFTAYAFGDLDCDGVYSTFFRTGEVLPGNEIRGGDGMQEINPTE